MDNLHKNILSLTFEDLKPDIWVWDAKTKWFYKIVETHEEDKTIDVIVHDDGIMYQKVVTLGIFEPNRFYAVGIKGEER